MSPTARQRMPRHGRLCSNGNLILAMMMIIITIINSIFISPQSDQATDAVTTHMFRLVIHDWTPSNCGCVKPAALPQLLAWEPGPRSLTSSHCSLFWLWGLQGWSCKMCPEEAFHSSRINTKSCIFSLHGQGFWICALPLIDLRESILLSFLHSAYLLIAACGAQPREHCR